MSGKVGASVPKFPSFRPRATDSKEHEASSTSARNKGENGSPKKHSHRHHRRLSNESSGTRSHPITRDLVKSYAPDVGGKPVEGRERSHKYRRSNDNSQIAAQQDVNHKQQDPESSLFFMDTRGDSQNGLARSVACSVRSITPPRRSSAATSFSKSSAPG